MKQQCTTPSSFPLSTYFLYMVQWHFAPKMVSLFSSTVHSSACPRPPQCCLLRHAIHCKSIQVTSTIYYVISAACLLCTWHIMKFTWYFQFEPKVEKLLPLLIIIFFQVWVRIFGEVWCFYFWSYHRLYGMLRLIYASMYTWVASVICEY